MRWIRFGIVIVLAAVIVCLFLDWRQSGLGFMPWLDRLPWFFTILTILLLFVAKTVIWFIHLRVLYLTAGFLMPALLAIIVIYAGLFLQLSIGYLIGMRSQPDAIHARMKKYKASRWVLRSVRQNPLLSCFAARFLPTPPTDLFNIFFGSLRIPYDKYIFASMLGLTPAMVPLVFVGERALDPLSTGFLLPFSISVLLAVLSLYFSLKIKKRDGNGEKAKISKTK